MAKTTLNVNGRDYEVPVDASDESIRLLWVLRNDLGLTGTKFGCGLAQCGACQVPALLSGDSSVPDRGKTVIT